MVRRWQYKFVCGSHLSLELLSLLFLLFFVLFLFEVELHSVMQVSLNPSSASWITSVLYAAHERLIFLKKEVEENHKLFCCVKSISRILVR